eukprot:TRINITY_DN3634_c0_g1_i6.p1 TRINITY_DN3634_c0_g1~~TRINITY_DN3634_c0_g1_i6.p1  ORF type:complete len:324 (-),score=47.61 TRINITY_DN3634_c0_g1_i6:305-1276(-)
MPKSMHIRFPSPKFYLTGSMICQEVVNWFYQNSQDSGLYNVFISLLCRVGRFPEAFQHYEQMVRKNLPLGEYTYAALFGGCAAASNLELGRQLHQAYNQSSLQSIVVCNALINMYGKCGRVEEAKQVFDSMPQRDVVSYSAMISVLCLCGKVDVAVQIYKQMAQAKINPNEYTYATLFSGCAGANNLELGRQLHRIYNQTSLQSGVVSNALIHMYGKCGRVEEAKRVFDDMRHRSVVSYSSMISVLGSSGKFNEAIQCYERMLQNKITPDKYTYAALLTMYGKFGRVEEAKQLFDSLKQRDLVLFGSIITVLCQKGRVDEAFQ